MARTIGVEEAATRSLLISMCSGRATQKGEPKYALRCYTLRYYVCKGPGDQCRQIESSRWPYRYPLPRSADAHPSTRRAKRDFRLTEVGWKVIGEILA